MKIAPSIIAVTLMGAAAPASAAVVQRIQTDFNLEGMTDPDVFLISVKDCGGVACSLGYQVWNELGDTRMQVDWVDVQGNTLVTGWSDPASLVGGGNAPEWSFPRLLPASTHVLTGTAHFTNFGPGNGNAPCSPNNYSCNADYLDWLNPFGDPLPEPGSGDDDDDSDRAETEAGLDILTAAPGASGSPADYTPDDYTREDVVDFISRVVRLEGLFEYQYEVVNHTDEALPFAWVEAGLVGTLDPLQRLTETFTSSDRPQVLETSPTVQLNIDQWNPDGETFGGRAELLAPVPVPPALLLLGSGLLGLLALGRSGEGRGAVGKLPAASALPPVQAEALSGAVGVERADGAAPCACARGNR